MFGGPRQHQLRTFWWCHSTPVDVTCQWPYCWLRLVMIDASEFVAGALCLDFINTVGGTRTGAYTDRLESYGDLLEWAVVGRALTRASAGRLAPHAADEPVVAEKVLAAAKALREALH